MCWNSRKSENIVLSRVSYQPPGSSPYHVFSSLGLSQLHVSYDDSNIIYNDVTQLGLGGEFVRALDDSDLSLIHI